MNELLKKVLPYIVTAIIGSGLTIGLGEYSAVKCVAVAKNPIAQEEQ